MKTQTTRLARLRAVSALFILAASFASFTLVGGCVSPPPRENEVSQDDGKVFTSTKAPNKVVTAIGGDEITNGEVTKTGKRTVTVDGVGPNFSSRLSAQPVVITNADGTKATVMVPFVDSVGNGASHEGAFATNGQWAGLRTSTVFSVKAQNFEVKPDGTVTVTGLEIGSDAAKANESVAVVVAAMTPAWSAWSADQRAAYEKYATEQAGLGKEGFKAITAAIDLLKKLYPTP